MQVSIDKFGLLHWMHGCAIGSHLRQGIWRRAVDEFYGKLTIDEREFVYTYAKRDIAPIFQPKDIGGSPYQHFGHEDFFHFLACYNPANRYNVSMEGKGVKAQTVKAYKWEGNYHVGFNRFCAPEYTKKATPCGFTDCGLACKLHEHCARFNALSGERLNLYADSECDWFIDKDTETGMPIRN